MKGLKTMTNAAVLGFGLAALMTGCGSSENLSNLDIVNGRTISQDVEPSVVFLYNPAESGEGGGVCTGTFVKPSVLITAAHCTDYVNNTRLAGANEDTEDKVLVIKWDETIDTDDNPDNGISGGYKLEATATRIFRHTRVTSSNIKTVHTGDVAILYFEDYQSSSYKNIARTSPRRGSTATIMGFGADSIRPEQDDDSVGTKRAGTVELTGISDFISFRGPSTTDCTSDCGRGVNAGPGDSGGPMFVNGELVATTSGGSYWSTSYVNVNSSSTRDFIDSVERIIGVSIND